jgi:hypothetical protein
MIRLPRAHRTAGTMIGALTASLLASTPAVAFPQTGIYYQPNARVLVSIYDGAVEASALLGGTTMPYQLLDLAARLPFPVTTRPFGWPLRVMGLVGYRQQSSDRGDTVRGLDMGIQAKYRLLDWLALHAEIGVPIMVQGSLAGANTGISPLPLPRFNLGASATSSVGVTAIVGVTVWSLPESLLGGGVFTGGITWMPGLLVGLNWNLPKIGEPLVPDF